MTVTQQDITPDTVAAKIMETTPLIMYFMRKNARRDKRTSSSLARVRVLACLQSSPGVSLGRVAESLNVTNATASALVEGLVQGGLIERHDDPKERRRVILKLTRAGQQQLEVARSMRTAEIAEILSDLPEQQLKQIQDGLSLLKESFVQASSHEN